MYNFVVFVLLFFVILLFFMCLCLWLVI